jgi:hypothetical protein
VEKMKKRMGMVVFSFFMGLVFITASMTAASTVPPSSPKTTKDTVCGHCGDVNRDGSIDISDTTYIISYLNGGPAPYPLCRADVNGDGAITYADAQTIILFLDQGILLPEVSCCQYGDANGDLTIDISDVVYLINFIFTFDPILDMPCMGDANQDGLADISDAVFLIHYIFGP